MMQESNGKIYKTTWEKIQQKFNFFNIEIQSIKDDLKSIQKAPYKLNFIIRIDEKCDWLSLKFLKYAEHQQTEINELNDNVDRFSESITSLIKPFSITQIKIQTKRFENRGVTTSNQPTCGLAF